MAYEHIYKFHIKYCLQINSWRCIGTNLSVYASQIKCRPYIA